MKIKGLIISATIVALLSGAFIVQAQTPAGQPPVTTTAGVYQSSPATCSSGLACYLQTDVNGYLKTTGSGGAAGPVTLADGADVAEGSTTDAAATAGSTGTVSAKLRLMTTQLSTINTTLGTPFQAGGSLAANQSVNLAQVAGATTATGNGTAAGSVRVALPTDGTGVVGLNAGAQIVGKVGIDQTTPGTTNGVQVNAALPAGTNVIGKTSIDQTTPGTTNLVAAGQSGTWTVQPGNTPNTTPWLVSTQPTTAGGLSVYFVQPTASDNHVVIKAGAGQVYKITATNNSATINYLRLYNATTGFNGCNSATNLVYQVLIPANSTNGGGISDSWQEGMAFATGISICVTSAYATTDTTNATASAMSINVGYK